jgi:primary-amine oxidase
VSIKPHQTTIFDDLVLTDFPPHYKPRATPTSEIELDAESTAPPSLSDNGLKRERIPPPMKHFDWVPELATKHDPNFKFREGLKPLSIVQPEGPSFTVKGHEIEWQGWKMHVGLYCFSSDLCQQADSFG